MKLGNVVPLIVFFLVGITLAYVTNLSSKASFMPSMVGTKVEVFETQSLNSDAAFSSDDLSSNDITILNLFASWCVSCKAEHELIKDLSQKGFQVYGLDVADSRQKALDYLQVNGNPYKKIGFDPQQRVAIALGATGVPETFVVDKNGIIYFHQRGMLDKDIIERQLLPVIDGMKKKKQ